MSRRTLREWEDFIKPFIGKINLLGEIPIPRLGVLEIGEEIRALLKRRGANQGSHFLDVYYPLTFVTYLALLAAHNTERNYWGTVVDNLGVTDQTPQQQEWGSKFLTIIRELGLPDFQDIQSYKFVAPIRLHGGIPAYSLPDFFEYILLPAIRSERYASLPTNELINEMLERSTVQLFVDSPVRYFLDYGGPAAHTFIDECRKMGRTYLKTNELPDPADLDIPLYVMRTFRQYMEEGQTSAQGKRYRSPFISLNPWGPSFDLNLPAQPVAGEDAAHRFYWEISAKNLDGTENRAIQSTRVRQRGYSYETEEIDLPMESPARFFQVTLVRQTVGDQDGEAVPIYSRRLHLLPTADEPPLQVFDPNSGKPVRWTQILPAGDFWLLYPQNTELEGNNVHLLETFPPFYGEWTDWQVNWWDLKKANAIVLVKDGENLTAPIPIEGSAPEPELIGENLLQQNLDPDETPLFIGPPPVLKIPLRPGKKLEDELSVWKIQICSRWAAEPIIQQEKPIALSQFSEEITLNNNAFHLPLHVLLGDSPKGTFDGSVSGPMGFFTSFEFRVWPDLAIDSLQPYYLPDMDGAQPIHFTLTIPKGSFVRPQPGSEGISVEQSGNVFTVKVGPQQTKAELFLEASLHQSEPVRVPLFLAIPRLRWSFPQGEQDKEIIWHTSPIQRSVDSLLQAQHHTLFIELPLAIEHPLLFTLHLIDPESGDGLQDSRRTYEANIKQTRWRFSLDQYSTTLRNLEEQPGFEFQLEILDVVSGKAWLIPLIYLSRTLEISAVEIEHLDELTFLLKWEEHHRLRNRRVRIWSVWQPWVLPLELVIPDNACDSWVFSEIGLPRSYYQLQFITANPWETQDPPLLPPIDSHWVKTITPEERLEWIENQIELNSHREFLLRFERMVIFHTNGNAIGYNAEVEWCYRNIENTSPDHIVALYSWLGQYDPINQRVVRVYMYRPELLRKLFEQFPNPNVASSTYLHDFPATSIVKPESATLLLNHDVDPRLVVHCLQILIRRNVPGSISYVVERVKGGALSDADAFSLMVKSPVFSLDELKDLDKSPIVLRLARRLVELIPEQQYFIFPDQWVLSDAGWGQIEAIQDSEIGESLEYFNALEQEIILKIVLRPGTKHPERIELNLKERKLIFTNAKQVYICTRCKFMTKNMNLLLTEHNHDAHFGEGPAFRQASNVLQTRQPTRYSSTRPISEWVEK